MLNWIDKRERLPKESDADSQGYVVGKDHRGARCYHFYNVKKLEQCTHWLSMKDIAEHVPLPKRWRTATIYDLAKAGKPIPCRMRDSEEGEWLDLYLCAVSVDPADEFCSFTATDANGVWRYCEIPDE